MFNFRYSSLITALIEIQLSCKSRTGNFDCWIFLSKAVTVFKKCFWKFRKTDRKINTCGSFLVKLHILACNFTKQNRSSCSQIFFKISVRKNFANFTGKRLCWSLVLIDFAGLEAYNFIKKKLQHRCFPVKFWIILRTPFFAEYLRSLLPKRSQVCKSFSESYSPWNAYKPLIFLFLHVGDISNFLWEVSKVFDVIYERNPLLLFWC